MNILVGIATRGNDLYYKTVEFLFHLKQTVKEGHSIEIALQPSPYSASYGQQKLFRRAMEGNFDYIMIIDADVCPPVDALDIMMAADKPVVLAPVWFYDGVKGDIHLNMHYKNDYTREYKTKPSGCERIVTGSFGLILIRKDALDKFKAAGETCTEVSSLVPEHMKKEALSDNIFFMKCIELGIETWVCWDVKGTVHYRIVELSDRVIDRIADLHR